MQGRDEWEAQPSAALFKELDPFHAFKVAMNPNFVG
jgi:hypothetical protein